MCSQGKVLVDQGDYNLNISHGSCSFILTNSPMNSNLCTFVFVFPQTHHSMTVTVTLCYTVL